MQTFDWGLIPSFLAVFEEGSLSGAARMLDHSQPTLGRHIAELEAQIGLTLFVRTGRGYVPTEAAAALFERAKAMRSAAAAISLAAEGRAETLEGTVRVTASEVVATYILPAILAPLLRQEPLLQIEVVASNSNENLLLREADVAVRMVEPTQSDLVAQKIGSLEMGLFAHEDYLARMGVPATIEEIRAHVFLGYDRWEAMIEGMRRFGVDAHRSDFRYRTDDQVAYAEAIVAGVGIGVAMVHCLRDRAGIVRVMDDMPIPPLGMWLAAHQELRTSARVRRVYDTLRDGLKEVCAR